MTLLRKSLSAGAAITALGMSANASAAELIFDWDAAGGGRDLQFVLDSEPTPDSLGGNYFVIYDVIDLLTAEVLDQIEFFAVADGGGFAARDSSFLIIANATGDQLFTGAVGDPVFKTGTFQLAPYSTADTGGTLTISAITPAVPEPSTWAMMLLGLFMIGGVMRHRPKVRNVSVSYS